MVIMVVGTPGDPESMTIMLTDCVEVGLLIVCGRLSMVAEVVAAIKVAVIVGAVLGRDPCTPRHTLYAPRFN